MFAWYGAACQLYSCRSSKKVPQISSEVEESRRLYALQFYSAGEPVLPPTTHREGLVKEVSLPRALTYNRGMAHHVVFDRVGLA